MRPLFHPSADEITVEGILHALSDPDRVAIYAGIVGSACAQNCTSFVHVSERDIPKSTLSQHFKVLREAGLIHGERRGIEVHNTSRCAEIEEHFPGLLEAIINAYRIEQAKKKKKEVGKRRRPNIKPGAGL